MKTSKEKQLFDLCEEHNEEELPKIGIHIGEDCYPDWSYRVYHADGYCFDIRKEQHCEPSDVNDYDIYELHEDGCTYHFSSQWDGFKDCSEEKAIELIQQAL